VTLRYPAPPLTDGVVLLRRWAESDLPCVEAASRDPVIPEGTTVPRVFSRDEGLAWIERQWRRAEEGQGLSLAIADAGTGEAVGVVVLLRPDGGRREGTAEIGYWVIEPARRRGLASRAVTLVARWGVGEGRLARIEALVAPENVPSHRVLERAGFHREGHLRSYLVFGDRRADMLIYSLLPEDV
jgi:ribosomal-protein-alanine N-acetyltransferase